MRIAVDVCIGQRGVELLVAAGHDVVVVAEHAESDREWFARAVAARAELVVACDADIEILCYDHRVSFYKARNGVRGVDVVARLVEHLQRPTRSRRG